MQPPPRLSTCIIIEHSKAVGVVVPEELPCNGPMVPADYLHVPLVKSLPEPRLVPCLLKESWGHVANNVYLQRGNAPGAGSEMPFPAFHFHPSKSAHRPKGSRQARMYFLPEVFPRSLCRQIQAFSPCPAMNIPHTFPPLCLCPGVPLSFSLLYVPTHI